MLLPENSRNFGQGIDVTKTAAEALTIAARNEEQQAEGEEPREYVLQPHIVRPLLFGGAKFHIRVCALLPSSPLSPRCAKEDPCSSLRKSPALRKRKERAERLACRPADGLMMLTPGYRYPRNFAHRHGKVAISSKAWSAAETDPEVQITTQRSGSQRYEDWEHYEAVHARLLEQTATLLSRLEGKVGPQAWAGRVGFELL